MNANRLALLIGVSVAGAASGTPVWIDSTHLLETYDPARITVTGRPLGDGASFGPRGPAIYSALNGPYLDPTGYTGYAVDPYAFYRDASGLNFDDARGDPSRLAWPRADTVFQLGSFTFAGGVNRAGGYLTCWLFSYGGGSYYWHGFDISLPRAGDELWTVTINTHADYWPHPAVAGGMRITPMWGTQVGGHFPRLNGVRWLETEAAPTIGTNDPSFGSPGPGRVKVFEMRAVPTPGAWGLLAAGGVVLGFGRRRG